MERAALVRIAPFALSIALLALSDLWPRVAHPLHEGVQLPAQWWYSLRTVTTGLLLAVFWPQYCELRRGGCKAIPEADSPARAGDARRSAPGTEARCWTEAVVVGLGVWMIWIWVGPLFRLGPGEATTDVPWPDAPAAALLWLVLRFAGAVVVMPVVEELFWRSYLMRWIDRASFLGLPPDQVSWFAMLLSSAVFATAHREVLAAFICGLVYAGFYRRHGQLRYVVAAHAVTNLALGIYVVLTQRWEFW